MVPFLLWPEYVRLCPAIEGGPPQGIPSRFDDTFKEKEEATHIKTAEVTRELG